VGGRNTGSTWDLYVRDLTRGVERRLTSDSTLETNPVWSPDGKRVAFAADRDGPQQIYVKTVDGGAPEQPLSITDVPFKGPSSWSPDSQWVVITQLDPETAQNIWLLPASGGDLKLFVRGSGRDNGGPVSPDGRWMAYVSDETGRFEAYLQSFPEPGRRIQVSQQGASLGWWAPDGRQLSFLGTDLHTLWRVDVEPGAALRVGIPRQIATFPASIVWMDAMPDRQRFLAIAPERTGIGSVTVVQNWLASLDKQR